MVIMVILSAYTFQFEQISIFPALILFYTPSYKTMCILLNTSKLDSYISTACLESI